MILIFEQDTTVRDGRRFSWRPERFTGSWGMGTTWRVGWGLWSLSYFPSPGLRAFMSKVENGETRWYSQSP